MDWKTIVIRLSLALVLGIIIGIERQLRQNTAGLRMNSLVAIGAASFVIFGSSIGTTDTLARVAAQIITGIGFLGAGVIMREGASIKGIATAATLWCSAAVGMFAGAGLVSSAIICTVFIVATNLFLRPLAWIIKKRIDMPHLLSESHHSHIYTISVTCQSNGQEHIRALLLQEINDGGLHLKKLESSNAATADCTQVSMNLSATSDKDIVLERIVSHLSLQPTVTAAKWHMGSSAT